MSMFDSSTAYLQEPRASAIFDPPDQSRIYKHFSEEETAYDELIKTENFLHEMVKFFTPPDQSGYRGEDMSIEAVRERLEGDEESTTDQDETTTNESPCGIWGKINDLGSTSSDWGFGKGSVGSNMYYDDISAGNFWNFTDLTARDTGPIDTDKTDYRGDWQEAVDFLGTNYDKQSYYDIVMGSPDWGTNGEGAYYLMLSMLESRRRVDYGLKQIFGEYSSDRSDASVISSMDSFFEKIKSTHYHNKTLLYMHFAALNNYSTIMQAYSNGVASDATYATLEEKSAFNSFATEEGSLWRYLDSYLAELNRQKTAEEEKSKEDQDAAKIAALQASINNINALKKEWLNPGIVGWNQYADQPAADQPAVFQPAVFQIAGQSESKLKSGSLYNSNWVAHFAGKMESFIDQDIEDALGAIALTMFDSSRYDSEKDSYDSKVRQAKDRVYYDKADEGNSNKKAAENKSKANRASDRARSERKAMNKKLEQSAAASRKQRASGSSQPAPAKPKPKEKKA